MSASVVRAIVYEWSASVKQNLSFLQRFLEILDWLEIMDRLEILESLISLALLKW